MRGGRKELTRKKEGRIGEKGLRDILQKCECARPSSMSQRYEWDMPASAWTCLLSLSAQRLPHTEDREEVDSGHISLDARGTPQQIPVHKK